MISHFLLLIFALVGIVFAADYFVKGAVSLARKLKLPDVIIGLTVVAIGTSAPELVINIFAATKGEGDIVVSNIIGSNLVNLCLGIGLAALIVPICHNRRTARIDLPLGLAGALLIYLSFFPDPKSPEIYTLLGIGLLFGFVLYLVRAKSEPDESDLEGELGKWVTGAFLVGGAILLPVFGNLIVNSSVAIAETIGIPKSIIGATIVAAGGSLPEVASCLAAARQGRSEIALGNVAGSQIFNLFGVLGLSALIGEIRFSNSLGVDLSLLVLITVAVMIPLCKPGGKVTKLGGVILVSSYLGYLCYLALKSSIDQVG